MAIHLNPPYPYDGHPGLENGGHFGSPVAFQGALIRRMILVPSSLLPVPQDYQAPAAMIRPRLLPRCVTVMRTALGLIAGTYPASAAAPFPTPPATPALQQASTLSSSLTAPLLFETPLLEANGWRLFWTSVPGATYVLQRWTSDQLGVVADPPWSEVATVLAAEPLSSAVDSTAFDAPQRFYRVLRLTSDVVSPTISLPRAASVTLNGQPGLRLEVTAQDAGGIAEVTFFQGDTALGTAQPVGDPSDTWSLSFSFDATQETAVTFVARAVDVAGNVAFSPALRYGGTRESPFQTLDASGQPTREPVEPGPNGLLPPFAYQPVAASVAGRTRTFQVRFPSGARLVTSDGREFLEFTEVEAGFGPQAPLQLIPRPPSPALQDANANPQRIPLGPLTVQDLAPALGYSPEEGIPVTVFDRFPLRWIAGTLEDHGIRGARFATGDLGLPLPAASGDYPEFVLPLDGATTFSLPFYGEYSLPDGTALPPLVRTSPADPGWLTLRADGTVTYRNRSDLKLPGGMKVGADLDLDLPVWRFQFHADRVHVPMIGSLADLLPGNPEACLPAGTTPSVLDQATLCLTAHARAYHLFSASAAAAAPVPEDLSHPGLRAPPDDVATGVSVLEAWIASARASLTTALPLGQLRELLGQTRQSAAAASGLEDVLRYRLALARLELAAAQGALSGSTETEAEIDAAVAEVELAALRRARDPNALRSLPALSESLSLLVDTQGVLQELERPSNPALQEALRDLLQDFLDQHLEHLGVRPGEFTLADNPVIAGLNRFAAFQAIRDLLDIAAYAALLDLEDSLQIPLDEALAQLALRLFSLVEVAFNEAEAAGDVPGFTFAMEDLLDLIAYRQLSIFPNVPALAALPATAQIPAYLDRLEPLLLADLARPYPDRSTIGEARQLRRLLRILREMPAGVTVPAEPFIRAYDRLTALLAVEMTRLPGIDNLTELLDLLDAGILHEQLRVRFNLVAPADWESTRLPLVTERLRVVALARLGWTELHRAHQRLLTEADHFAALNDQTRRRLYLARIAHLLPTARTVAVLLWQAENSRRASEPALFLADLLLPGDIHVDKVAGSAQFDLETSEFKGSFQGKLRLPKFQGELEILHASVSSLGQLDLAAHGTVSFQGVTVTLTRRQPLHLQYRHPQDLRLSGEASLVLPNGIRFAARLTLDDPLYGFRIEARDLRLDLARQLLLLRPTVDTTALSNASDDLRVAFLDYYGSLNAALEALATQTGSLPDLDASGTGLPPEFESPQLTLPFSQVNAWANAVRLDLQRGIAANHNLLVPDLRSSLQAWREDAELATRTFQAESRFLDDQLQRLTEQRRGAESLQRASDAVFLGNPLDREALREEWSEISRNEARRQIQFLTHYPPQSIAEGAKVFTSLVNLAATVEVLDLTLEDLDGDGIPNHLDLCPADPNPSGVPQTDTDGDGFGDACDPAPSDPNLPGPGACGDYLRLAGQPLLQAQALYACLLDRHYASMGLDPATGAVTNQVIFNSFSADALEERLNVTIAVAAQAQAVGIPPGPLNTTREVLTQRLMHLQAQEISQLPESDLVGRYDRALALVNLALFTGNSQTLETVEDSLHDAVPGLAKLSPDDLDRLDQQIAQRRKVRSERMTAILGRDLGLDSNTELDLGDPVRRRGVVGDTLVLLRVLFADNDPEGQVYRERIDTHIQRKIQRLQEELVDPNYIAARLSDGAAIAATLADATAWVLEMSPADEPRLEQIRLTLEDVTLRFTTLAEARRAWWFLRQYGDVLHVALREYGEGMGNALRQSYRQSYAATVLASSRITDALANAVSSVGAESLMFQLPGDLRVRRVFGGLEYNRDTEVFTGNFGGRLEFPDLDNAFFEIANATLATDGTFQIAAATGGPLPFGRLRLTTGLQVAGSLSGLQSITGSGSLLVPVNTSTQLFSVTASYSAPARRLSFDTTGAGLDWRATDDFVLFNGGLGFDLSTATPAGALRFSGSAGMFARQTPLPATLTRTNFHLVATNTALTLLVSDSGFGVSLTNGTLLLPEFLQTSLFATNRITTNFLASPKGTNSVLTNFVHGVTSTNPPPGTFGAALSLNPTNPIAVSITFDPPRTDFSGELLVRDVGFQVPDYESIELAVGRARLIFPTNQLPVLTNFHAALQFPLPGQTNIIEVVDAAWSIDGFPTGTVRLRTDLDLFDLEGWRLTLLGTESALCQAGTGLTLGRDTNSIPFLRLDAGVEFAMPGEVISDELGESVSAAACGSLRVPFQQFPEFSVNSLGVGLSSLRLGGTNGVLITNAVLQVTGLTNLFQQSPQTPMRLTLGGMAIFPPGLGFGMSNAVFHFEGQPLPRFTVSELAFAQSGSFLTMAQDLPLNVSELRFRFLNDALPLHRLFAQTNISLLVSGSAALPPGENAVVAGLVNDLGITFLPTGQPLFSVDAIGFKIDLTEFIGDALPLTLGGDVYIGGLTNPPNYLFAGKLKGNFKGNAVEGLVALDPCGLRGVCFGLAGAEISIQLGYGFVLTGAKGGLSLANSNADPCDFLTHLPIDPITGRPTGGSTCQIEVPTNCPPALTFADLGLSSPLGRDAALRRPPFTDPLQLIPGNPPASPERSYLPSRHPLHGLDLSRTAVLADFEHTNLQPLYPTTFASTGSTPQATSTNENDSEGFPCPTIGACPPASVNIYCQPHPDFGQEASPHANRVITKFTAIDESLLQFLGITPEFIASLLPQFTANPSQIAIDFAHTLREHIDFITPRAPADAPDWIRAADAQIEQQLDQVQLDLANQILCALQSVPTSSTQLANDLYAAIRDTLWAGIPCPDLTLKLEGSVSYTGVSPFANISGGVIFSTTGSAGIVGAVNVFGIPVGKARLFLNQTDAYGNPTLPNLCGEIIGAVGPLELGSLAFLEDCPDCTTKLFNTFANLFTSLGDANIDTVMAIAFPDLADPANTPAQNLALLDTPDRQMAFMAALFHAPPRDAQGRVTEAFLDFAVSLADAVLPRLAACGEIQPKLFGFPLMGGAALSSYRMFAGPREAIGLDGGGFLYREAYGFSPSQMLAYYALAATGVGSVAGMFAPAIDQATAALSYELPTFGQIIRDSFTLPAPQFLAQRTEDFLQSALITFDYRLAPFGMELGRTGGRILLPSLEHHPRGPHPRTPPEDRRQGLPNRLEVLLAALGDKDNTNAVNRLSDESWKGEGDAAFAEIFAGSPYANTVLRRNLSLRDDYFPHGGFLAAGTLDLPAVITRPLPPSLATLLDTRQTPLDRFTATTEFVFDHLLASDRVGELAFYIPAPNPPLDRFPTTALDLMESLRNFVPDDPLQMTSYFPVDRGFLSGWLDTPVLGIPTVRSQVDWVPADNLLRMQAQVPTASWFNRLIGHANFQFELRGNSNVTDTLNTTFLSLSNQVRRLDPNSPRLTTDLNAIATTLPGQLAQTLPKVSLLLSASNVRIPVPTYSPSQPLLEIQTVARISNAVLEAYSPYFNPGSRGTSPVERVRREGGMSVRGDFNFLNGVVRLQDAELAVIPTPNALGLPTVVGQLEGSTVNILGVPFGPPPPATTPSRAALNRPAPQFMAASPTTPRVEFRSDNQAVRLTAEGSLPEVTFGPLLSIQPLQGNAIGAVATFETRTADLPEGSLALRPARIASSLFPPGRLVLVHGRTTNDAFTLSTSGNWTAGITIPAGDGIDVQVGGETILRLSRTAAAAGQDFRATLSGTGTSYASMAFTNLAVGLQLVTFPNTPTSDPRRQTLTLGPTATLAFNLDTEGQFDLRATVPTSRSFTGLPFASLAPGWDLRLNNQSLTLTGTTEGGLLETLGINLLTTLTLTQSGISFSGQASVGPLDYGVFRIASLSDGPVTASINANGLQFPSGARLSFTGLATPTVLTLPAFTMANNGSFTVSGTANFIWDGRTLASANYTLSRNAAGTTSFQTSGSLAPISLAGIATLEPRTGANLNASLALASNGNASFQIGAARLQLTGIGVGGSFLIHGAGNLNAAFTFSSSQPWNAALTVEQIRVDPVGTIPELLRLSPATGSTLFNATLNGQGTTAIGFSANRTGTADLQVLPNNPMASLHSDVNLGTQSLSLTTNGVFQLTLDPPDLEYFQKLTLGGTTVTMGLSRLTTGSLQATASTNGASVTLVSPSVTLLPNSFLEQTLSLPSFDLSADQFTLNANNRTLAFPHLPGVNLTGNLILTPTGFRAQNLSVSAGNWGAVSGFPALLQIGSSASGNELISSNAVLTLRSQNPNATVLGVPLTATQLGPVEFTLAANSATTRSFTGSFSLFNNADFFGSGILKLANSRAYTLSATVSNATGVYALSGDWRFDLRHPNPNNLTATQLTSLTVPFQISQGTAFSHTLSQGLPEFDLGWLEVDPGQVQIQRAANGTVTLSFTGWRVELFGRAYTNQTLTFDSTGLVSRNLTASTFDFGTGINLLRLTSGAAVPFTWNGANGAIAVNLPNTASIHFPSIPGLTGTLKDGLAFPTTFPTLTATGTFDRSWTHTLTFNGLNLGTRTFRWYRQTANGPVRLESSANNILGLTGLSYALATSSDPTSFSATMSGAFAIGGYQLGSVNLSLDTLAVQDQFKGKATIFNPATGQTFANSDLYLGSNGVTFLGLTFPLP